MISTFLVLPICHRRTLDTKVSVTHEWWTWVILVIGWYTQTNCLVSQTFILEKLVRYREAPMVSWIDSTVCTDCTVYTVYHWNLETIVLYDFTLSYKLKYVSIWLSTNFWLTVDWLLNDLNDSWMSLEWLNWRMQN